MNLIRYTIKIRQSLANIFLYNLAYAFITNEINIIFDRGIFYNKKFRERCNNSNSWES